MLRSVCTKSSFTSYSWDLVTQFFIYLNLLHHDKPKNILRAENCCYSMVLLRASHVRLIGGVLSWSYVNFNFPSFFIGTRLLILWWLGCMVYGVFGVIWCPMHQTHFPLLWGFRGNPRQSAKRWLATYKVHIDVILNFHIHPFLPR